MSKACLGGQGDWIPGQNGGITDLSLARSGAAQDPGNEKGKGYVAKS